jgi:hypothetical protein
MSGRAANQRESSCVACCRRAYSGGRCRVGLAFVLINDRARRRAKSQFRRDIDGGKSLCLFTLRRGQAPVYPVAFVNGSILGDALSAGCCPQAVRALRHASEVSMTRELSSIVEHRVLSDVHGSSRGSGGSERTAFRQSISGDLRGPPPGVLTRKSRRDFPISRISAGNIITAIGIKIFSCRYFPHAN